MLLAKGLCNGQNIEDLKSEMEEFNDRTDDVSSRISGYRDVRTTFRDIDYEGVIVSLCFVNEDPDIQETYSELYYFFSKYLKFSWDDLSKISDPVVCIVHQSLM